MTVSNTVFTVFSGIGVILSVVPLWWHLPSWNMHVATCMYMIWTALACLVYFVDSIVWSGNAINWAPVWCDIAFRIQIGASIAWPACVLCIIRRIYNITATTIPSETRRETIIELLITIGLPLVEIILQYVVAGHRFNIYEDYGCAPATWDTHLSYVLIYSWPLIISTVSAVYGALALCAFLKRRKELKDLDAELPYKNYWRLVAFSSVDFFSTIPLAIWNIVLNLGWGPVSPWVSWDDTHWGYSRVFQFPRAKLEPSQIRALEVNRWVAVYCAFVFFGFFGFAGEAKKNYRLLAFNVAKLFGHTASTENVATPGQRVDLPLHFASRHTQQIETKEDSDSVSDKLSISIALDGDDLKSQSHPATQQSTSSSLTNSPVDRLSRVPESPLEPPVARRVSTQDTPKVIYLGDAHDQV